jgi:hypothetical protein
MFCSHGDIAHFVPLVRMVYVNLGRDQGHDISGSSAIKFGLRLRGSQKSGCQMCLNAHFMVSIGPAVYVYMLYLGCQFI